MKIGHHRKDNKKKEEIPSSIEEKKTFFGSFLYELRKRKIIETLAAFIGGGWLIIEFVHWILVDHYHFPEKSIDITFISLFGALISTIIWRLYYEARKRERKIKIEYVFISLVILATVILDISFIRKTENNKLEKRVEIKWKNSIAVLPFEDLSPWGDQEYLSDGMTDAIISKLSKLSELKVVSRTSVMRYKKIDKDIKVIGEELNVSNILEGTVQKAENKVRVRAQLINTQDGFHLWSETYDQKIENIFTLQDKISHAIVDALKIKIGEEKTSILEKHPTENVDAYTLYLKGRSYWNERSAKGFKNGMIYFERAIEKDPDYALAYSGIADSYIGLANFNVLPPHEAYPQAREWALKALDLDDSLAEAHASMGIIKLFYDWDWRGAKQKFKRALELNPNYVTAYQTYALYFAAMGEMDEAKKEIQKARELDPQSLPVQTATGFIFHLARQDDLAIKEYTKILTKAPLFPLANFYLGMSYVNLAMHEEALEMLKKALEHSAGNLRIKSWLAHSYALVGKREEALRILDDLKELSSSKYVDPIYLALINIGLGDRDQAMELLEKGYEERSFLLIWIKMDPVFDQLRSDNRFQDLLLRMKLDAHSK